MLKKAGQEGEEEPDEDLSTFTVSQLTKVETETKATEPFYASPVKTEPSEEIDLSRTPVFEPEIVPEIAKSKFLEPHSAQNPETPSFIYNMSTTSSFFETSADNNTSNMTFESAKNYHSSPIISIDKGDLLAQFESLYIGTISEKVASLNSGLARRVESRHSEFVSANNTGSVPDLSYPMELKNRSGICFFLSFFIPNSAYLTKMAPAVIFATNPCKVA